MFSAISNTETGKLPSLPLIPGLNSIRRTVV